MSRYVLRTRKFIREKILHATDTPHRIALGVSVAMFAMVLPIPGQTLIALTLAAFLGANKAVCIPVVWISNPFTALPIWGAALALAQVVLPTPTDPAAEEQLRRLASIEVSLLSSAFWRQVLTTVVDLGAHIWVGCIILGILLAVVTYYPSKWAVRIHRERRRLRSQRRHHFRVKAKSGAIRTASGSPSF